MTELQKYMEESMKEIIIESEDISLSDAWDRVRIMVLDILSEEADK